MKVSRFFHTHQSDARLLKNAFVLSCGFHTTLFLLILIQVIWGQFHSTAPTVLMGQAAQARTAPQPIIQAVQVDESKVQAAMTVLRAQAEAKQAQAEAEAAHLQSLREKNALAERKMKALQAHAKVLAQRRAEEKARVAELAKQKAAIEKQKVLAKKSLDQMQDKIQSMQAALAAKKQAQAEAAARQAAEQAKVTAAAEQSAINHYKALILQAISAHWVLPDNIDQNAQSEFLVMLDQTGKVLSVTLTKTSGDPIIDRSARTAILKASPLPIPSDPKLVGLFRELNLKVKPENIAT